MQITIRLDPATYVALQDLAIAERRRIRDQAVIIIRDGIRQTLPREEGSRDAVTPHN